MLRTVDSIACTNRWRNHSGAVAWLCLGLMIDALLAPPLPGAPIVIAATLLLAVAGARVPARAYCRAMLVPLGFLAVGTLGLCGSLELGSGWVLHFSPGAAMTALRSALRAWAGASVTLLFAFTVPVAQLIRLLRRLHTPTSLLELIHLTYRSLFLLDEFLVAIVGTQRSRLGYRSLTTALRSSGQAAAALFVRALMLALRWDRGLHARGYNGHLVVLLPPSSTRPLHLVFATAAAALVGGASWLGAWTWSP